MSDNNDRKRLREIVTTFIKYGIRDGIGSINNPVQLRMALEELGPTFIKIGQILSTRPDILPEPFTEEFKKLHDNVRPEKFEDIKVIIESELGKPLEKLFLFFDIEPIASASMAEVHLAKLNSGEDVVVKIQRPKARETMLSDINILKKLARLLKLTPQGSVMNPVEVVEELSITLKSELDFLNEARNIKLFSEYNKDVKCITCPGVFDKYTTQNILVMEFIKGIKIVDVEALDKEGYILEDIAAKLANNYMKQIFTDGFFHADPHPGNIFVVDNKIAYIDFGMMGTLSKNSGNKFMALLKGVASRDIDAITNSILKIGIKRGSIDYKKFRSDVEQIYSMYADLPLDEINLPQMIDEIFKVCKKNNISIPKDITMLLKGIMTLEGVISCIAPDISIMEIAIPFARNQAFNELDIKKDLLEQLENIYHISKHGLKMPTRLMELINIICAGKLKVNMEHTNLEKIVVELHKMVNRLVFGIITASLIVGSSLIIRADAGPKLFHISMFWLAGFTGAAFLGFWLLISTMRSGKL